MKTASHSYFDVAVIGLRLPSLVAAALLAKRGFRVALVPQGALPWAYTLGHHTLGTASNAWFLSESPVIQQIFSELALQTVLRQHIATSHPLFQIALPNHRLDVFQDSNLFQKELQREFPTMTEDFWRFEALCQEIHHHLDGLLHAPLAWPPKNFWQRHQWNQASPYYKNPAQGLAKLFNFHSKNETSNETFNEHSNEHSKDEAFTRLLNLPLQHNTPVAHPEWPSFFAARLHAQMRTHFARIEGGMFTLWNMLLEVLQKSRAVVFEHEHAERVEIYKRKPCTFALRRSGETLSARTVLLGVDPVEAKNILHDPTPIFQLEEKYGIPTAVLARYTLHCAVRPEVLPTCLAQHVFFCTNLDLQKEPSSLHIELQPSKSADEKVLSIHTLVPHATLHNPQTRLGLRAQLLKQLEELIPFVEENLLWMDSPHDGLEPESTNEDLLKSFGSELPAWTRGPHTSRSVYRYNELSTLGLCTSANETPQRNLVMCNEHQFAGLGMEGEFFSGLVAANRVTDADRKHAQVRRGTWNAELP